MKNKIVGIYMIYSISQNMLYVGKTENFTKRKWTHFSELNKNIHPNALKAWAKTYLFINPQGQKIEIYNLNKFCKENFLSTPNMIKVINGERKQHKNYTKYEETTS